MTFLDHFRRLGTAAASEAPRRGTVLLTATAMALGLGWSARERAFALEKGELLRSGTINADQVKMVDQEFRGELVGHLGVYFQGDAPASTQFVAGRFVLEPGKTNHLPHTHPEEEVLIVDSGQGEIFCEGKTTAVGPGSIMFTTPNAPHGIKSTGTTPLTFYFVKWVGKETPKAP